MPPASASLECGVICRILFHPSLVHWTECAPKLFEALFIMSFSLNGIFIKEPVVATEFLQAGIQGHQVAILYKTNTLNAEVPSPIVKINFLLIIIMDVGKSKYRGPFTTEQVEDVKTFLES